MEFGISLLPDVDPSTHTGADYYRDVFAMSRLADRLGYSHVKMTEHYLHPYGGYCPSPLTFLAAVAARTERVRLMTGCVLPSFHHPVKLASYASMVDAISGGRLDVGFARAYLPYEFETFEVPMDGSRERFEATVAAVVRLWTEEDVTEKTDFFSFSDATILPRPTQQPHPPVYVAAVKTDASFVRVGQLGHGLLITPSGLAMNTRQVRSYVDAFEPSSAATPRPRVVASLPLLVAETDADARRMADPHLARYLQVWTSATDSWNASASRDYPSYTGMSRYLRTLTPRDLRTSGSAIVGSPESVLRRTEQFIEQVGQVDSIVWQVDYGGMPYDVAARSLELFATEVMPKLTA
ncbi:monooxygenase [Longimycelium tulufanense]|uniref:Monooxygenase n=1 Tax=Longimycelium tulufanense TaxID=907463 RepID=A0A8J3CFR6_9PSEU|nr:LLM class flavin-dependent oxidoreductase [Longimycelium tulufanense]GGM60959.1 monooxygenase [Longimycelium tulufanense]